MENLRDFTKTVSSAARGLTFARYAKALAVGKGDKLQAAEFAQAQTSRGAWADTPGVVAAFKTAISAMTTGNALGAPRAVVDDFLALVRPRTLLDKIVGWHRVPMNTSILAFTGDATGHITAEGLPKALSEFDLTRITLPPMKAAAIAVVTAETLRHGDPLAELSLGVELARALAKALDRAAFDPNVGTSIPAGGTVISSSGSTLAAIDADLKLLIDAFAGADAALDSCVFVMSATTAAYLGSLRGAGGNLAFPNVGARGGSILQIPVYVSSSLIASGSPGESSISLVDPTQILLADEGVADVQLARSASLQMDGAPTNPVSSSVNLWQSNLIALRSERWISWKTTTTSACATLDDVTF